MADTTQRTCGHLRLFSWDVPAAGVFVRGTPAEIREFPARAQAVFRRFDDAGQERWSSFDWFGLESDTVWPLARLVAALEDLVQPADVVALRSAFASALASPRSDEVLYACRNSTHARAEIAFGGLFEMHPGADAAWWAATAIAEAGPYPVGEVESLSGEPFVDVVPRLEWLTPTEGLSWFERTLGR